MLVMFGLGLSLTLRDFERLWYAPKAIFVGLLGQLIVLPALAFLVCIMLDLPEHIALGLLIIAACPGGVMSNVFSQLAKADLALSVTLTAFSTIICAITAPFVIQFAISYFSHSGAVSFSVFGTTMGMIGMTLLPVLIGLYCRHKFPEGAKRKEAFFRRFSLVFVVSMILAILIQEHTRLIDALVDSFASALLLNFTAIFAGICLGLLFRLPYRQVLTICLEVGFQNPTLAILIALTFLNKPSYALPAGIYGLVMYIGGAIIVSWSKKQGKRFS
jgi:BASS family bile acid:Na+ symporter